MTTPYGEPIISSSEWDSEGRSRTGSGREDDERSIDEHNVDDCLRPVTENHNPNNSEESTHSFLQTVSESLIWTSFLLGK